MKRYEAIAEKVAAAGEKKSALMLSGAVKSLISSHHNLFLATDRLDKMLDVLIDTLQEPIDETNRNKALRNLSQTSGLVSDLQKLLGLLSGDLNGISESIFR